MGVTLFFISLRLNGEIMNVRFDFFAVVSAFIVHGYRRNTHWAPFCNNCNSQLP